LLFLFNRIELPAGDPVSLPPAAFPASAADPLEANSIVMPDLSLFDDGNAIRCTDRQSGVADLQCTSAPILHIAAFARTRIDAKS